MVQRFRDTGYRESGLPESTRCSRCGFSGLRFLGSSVNSFEVKGRMVMRLRFRCYKCRQIQYCYERIGTLLTIDY